MEITTASKLKNIRYYQRRVVKKRRKNKEILRIYQTIKVMVRTRIRIENELMESDLIDDDYRSPDQKNQRFEMNEEPELQKTNPDKILGRRQWMPHFSSAEGGYRKSVHLYKKSV